MSDSLKKIAKDISRLGWDFQEEWTYDEQVRHPSFVRLLMYNCILFDRLYSCARNGFCIKCKAYDVIRAAEDSGGDMAREVEFWRGLLGVEKNVRKIV